MIKYKYNDWLVARWIEKSTNSKSLNFNWFELIFSPFFDWFEEEAFVHQTVRLREKDVLIKTKSDAYSSSSSLINSLQVSYFLLNHKPHRFFPITGLLLLNETLINDLSTWINSYML